MELVHFDPFSVLRDVDRMLEHGRTWVPRIDVFDRESDLVVRLEVPGIDAEDIDVTVEDRTLTISGRREFRKDESIKGYHRREIFEGEFTRTIMLPEGVDTDSIAASAKAGLLEVSVPRKPEVLPRKVKVDVTG